ncbi:MAG: twin-arginine translocation signal domain-containing protein [Candidatus Coatesbacteria bacterium]|nr:MAG: twin-arginine translocation signal domain-containing protein [Candidatus Coatesbacteria bacterium]
MTDREDRNTIDRRDFLKLGLAAGAFALVGGAVPRVVFADELDLDTLRGVKTLLRPHDVAVAPDGTIYVANSGMYGVVRVSDGDAYVLGAGPGTGEGQLNFPRGVCAAPDGSIYVADTNNARLQVFDGDGSLIRVIGRPGYLDGEFLRPRGLDVRGRLLAVADNRNHRVQILDLDRERLDRQPVAVALAGGHGENAGRMKLPADVAFDADGDVHAIVKILNVVKVYGTDGAFKRAYGAGDGLNGPEGICRGEGRTLYVADTGNGRVLEYNVNGEHIREMKPKTEMVNPTGLAYYDGTLLAADPSANAVHVIRV